MWEKDGVSNFLMFQELGEEQLKTITKILFLQQKLLRIPNGTKDFYELEFIRRLLLLIPKFPIDESILEKLEKAERIIAN